MCSPFGIVKNKMKINTETQRHGELKEKKKYCILCVLRASVFIYFTVPPIFTEVISMKSLKLILMVFCISFVITGVSLSGEVANMVQNPSFEDGTTGWQLLVTAPAAATWKVEKDGVVGQCVHITITAVSGTSWHVEIHQPGMSLKLGQEYTYNFWYKAADDEVRVIQPGVEGLGASDWWQDINIKGTWEEFTKTWIQSLAGSATLHFAVAQTKGEVYLDQVRLYEGKYQKEDIEALNNEKGKAVEFKNKLATVWGDIRKSN